ncbi:MAG: HAMP domain-containing histidine kinase [Myxococcales bacterium]|nr:HAMP domain-containing histidine kinase [Myxococcales bacterium]
MSDPTETPVLAMVHFARAVADAEDPGQIAAQLADAVERSVGAVAVAVYTTTDDGALQLSQTRGCTAADLEPIDLMASDTWTYGMGRIEAACTVHALPLASGGGLYGLLLLGWAEPDEHLSDHIDLASGLADAAAVGFDRAYRTRQLVTSLTELAERNAELARTAGLRRMGQMAAVLAHEIRNPLAGVRGVLEVLRPHFEVDSGERRALTLAQGRLDELGTLVSDLLVYARPREPSTRCSSVGALVEAAVALDGAQAHEVRVRVEPVDLTWSLDPEMVARLLTNLLRNAAQATPESGIIEVGAEVDERGWLRLWVTDSGPGISEEQVADLFEPFVTTKEGGTGLGLAICRSIALAHGGTLEHHCGTLGGACFTLRLPPGAPP